MISSFPSLLRSPAWTVTRGRGTLLMAKGPRNVTGSPRTVETAAQTTTDTLKTLLMVRFPLCSPKHRRGWRPPGTIPNAPPPPEFENRRWPRFSTPLFGLAAASRRALHLGRFETVSRGSVANGRNGCPMVMSLAQFLALALWPSAPAGEG